MFHYATVTDPVSLWRTSAIGAIRLGVGEPSRPDLTSCRHCAFCALSRRHRASAHFVEQTIWKRRAGPLRASGTGHARHVYLVGGDMESTPRRLVPIILSALVALPALLVAQQPVTVTGKVTSDAGQSLGQVEIAIPTMGLGGLTKDDGRYVIVVPGARVSGTWHHD